MEKRKIENRLRNGSASIVSSVPFSCSELRKLAKAAQQGNTTLTIVVHDEILTDFDIDNIRQEAPSNVIFDYSHCKL